MVEIIHHTRRFTRDRGEIQMPRTGHEEGEDVRKRRSSHRDHPPPEEEVIVLVNFWEAPGGGPSKCSYIICKINTPVEI